MLKYVPRGKMIIIGGGEDKGERSGSDSGGSKQDMKPMEILKQLLPSKKSNPSIEIITSASSDPKGVIASYRSAMHKAGFKKVGFMNIGNNQEGFRKIYLKRVKKADVVFFSGGDQYRLAVILGNTEVLDIIRERYVEEKDFTVAGTSAGAMAMTTLMMFEGEKNEAILKGTVKISSGLSLLNDCIIDSHFAKRGRFGRLAQAVIMNPTCIGLGLGEDTALIIKRGKHATCIGSGMVLVIDGRKVGHTNVAYAENMDPLCIENLCVHILCNRTGFELDSRKFIPSRKDMEMEKKSSGKIKARLR